jgi:hypothetical protein
MSEPATEVLRGTEARDVLALVPHLLGFEPAESLVLVCLLPCGRRVGMTMRQDLPPDSAWDLLPAAVAAMELPLARGRPGGVLAVVYSEREVSEDVLAAVRRFLHRHRVPLRGARCR